jgi:hypothetical protein
MFMKEDLLLWNNSFFFLTWILSFRKYACFKIEMYRVIKKSLCTWRLQNKKHAKIQYFKQNTFGMWTVLYRTRSSRTHFGVSINVWRMAGDILNITCNFLYCNHQVHRDFLITMYLHLGHMFAVLSPARRHDLVSVVTVPRAGVSVIWGQMAAWGWMFSSRQRLDRLWDVLVSFQIHNL